jgi:hypothetical protein
MFETMKIIHMLALLGGGAGAIGNGVLLVKVMKGEGPPPPMVQESMKIIGMTGLVSIILLWVTGIIMVSQTGRGIDWEFAVKLIGAAMVLGTVSWLSLLSARAAKAGTPPPMQFMKQLASIARIGLLLAIIFAVTAFN